jgi:hypothetical protein
MRSDIARGKLAEEMLAALNKLKEDGFDKKLVKQDKEKDVSLPAGAQSLYEILKLLLKIKSNEYGIVAHLITSEKELREYKPEELTFKRRRPKKIELTEEEKKALEGLEN